jgi:myo-inositol-hexaphosphate 3-phosphohydrolase
MVVNINRDTTAEYNVSSPILELGFDANDVLIYVGKAAPGSLTSEAVWFIEKIVYDASGNLLKKIKANGLNVFNMIWDDRALLSYS